MSQKLNGYMCVLETVEDLVGHHERNWRLIGLLDETSISEVEQLLEAARRFQAERGVPPLVVDDELDCSSLGI
jgi:hypothetical protein